VSVITTEIPNSIVTLTIVGIIFGNQMQTANRINNVHVTIEGTALPAVPEYVPIEDSV
jgi:hypothetical protein